MKLPSQNQRWESPTAYIGKLPTTGKGVGVVVLDEGFDLNHPDLKGRVAAAVTTSPGDRFDADPVGHGTHTLGVVGGSGAASEGQIQGVAPGAHLIPVKVNVAQTTSWQDSTDSVAKGINWAIQNKEQFNIKVINCSFTLPLVESLDPETGAFLSTVDPLSYALNLAKEAGIVVVAGAGNEGSNGRIMTPAGDPSVITVGALDTAGTPQDPSDDSVAGFSSRGESIHGEIKPDILAPGVAIMAASAPNSQFEQRNVRSSKFVTAAQRGSIETVKKIAQVHVKKGLLQPEALALPEPELRKAVADNYQVRATAGDNGEHPAYIALDGTSDAAPIVTGVIAHMFEANPDLTPEQVKSILYSTADSVAGDAAAVGHGALDAQEALQEAIALRPS